MVQAAGNDRLVGELQSLDVSQRVRTVRYANGRTIAHGDDGLGTSGGGGGSQAGSIDRGAIDCEGVVRQRRGEHRRVEAGRGRILQLAHDLELVGAVRSGQHGWDEIDHAVGAGELDIMIGLAAHADAHVQPGVAVDQVVAALADDDVAAFAAENDVAGTEASYNRGRRRSQEGIEEVLQPVDEAGVEQDAAERRNAGPSDGGRIGIIAEQEVVVVRSRQACHQIQPWRDRRGRPRHLRLVEEAQARVEADGHADRVVLEGSPVETAKADEAIRLAGRGDIDVVAAFAIDVVGTTVALEDVVALHRLIAERIEVVAGSAVARAALDPVIALVAEGEFVRFAAEQEVVARAAEDLRRILAADDEVLAEAAEEDVGTAAALDDVVAVLALDDVVAALVGDDVVAGAAEEMVITGAAFDAIVAFVAIDRIVAPAGDEDVIGRTAAQHDSCRSFVDTPLVGKLQIIRIGPDRQRVVPDDQ